MNEHKLNEYYNKFNEDKRLSRRHGIVEFETTIKYINYYLKKFNNPKILDIGAGTGKYSIYYANKNYDVTAIELVKHNLMVIKKRSNLVKSFLGNAKDLSKWPDETFDVVLLFGPMYHLISFQEKLQALLEAKRVTKRNGLIFISYYMNEYAIIKHGFIDQHIMTALANQKIDENFKIICCDDELYSMVRLEDINQLRKDANLKRIKILAQDGASDYIRRNLNALSEEEFALYLKYHFSICERKELLGASSHVLDILRKVD